MQTQIRCLAAVALILAPSLATADDTAESVVFRCNFESPTWWKEWDLREPPRRTETVAADAPRKFEAISGKALRVRVDKGGHYGVSLEYRFDERLGQEPEAIYFQYDLRLADDWNPQRGGKLPGIGGTYGRAGWGGRPADGTDGWSARGLFQGQERGRTPIGFYCYHADMRGKYGDNWLWNQGSFQGLENNRWYRIRQFAKMNAPRKKDGVLQAWVDGKMVFEKKDVRMRKVDSLKIETVWINLYHGGSWTAKSNHHLYIDNVLISRDQITE